MQGCPKGISRVGGPIRAVCTEGGRALLYCSNGPGLLVDCLC